MTQRNPRQSLSYFRWQGRDQHGQKRAGSLFAGSESEVRRHLNGQHIRLARIRPCARPLLSRFTTRIASRDITLFTRQLATMLSSGVPILDALNLVRDHHRNHAMQALLNGVIGRVEAGTPLSDSLRSALGAFDPVYIALVASAEQSGQLSRIFCRLASYRENSEQLRAKVIKALIYPAVVIAAAVLVTYLMLTMVIPEFEAMFRGFGAQLPWFTRQVIYASELMRQAGLTALAGIFLATLTLNALRRRSKRLRRRSHQWVLSLPVFGGLLRKAALARFSRTLATSFAAGVPILQSLQGGARTCGNLHYQFTAEQLCHDAAAGIALHHAMRRHQVFPELMIQMVMIGEQAGRLDEMLNKVADLYEHDVENSVDNLGKLIEPVLILLLGGLVGGLVIAMYLPIFNLMSVLG